MQKSCFCNFMLGGVSITEFGMIVPSPFCSLELTNSEISSMTSWSLRCIVGGDSRRKINIAAFEALIYSASQQAVSYSQASGIPVSFIFGWLNPDGSVAESLSYQGFTLTYKVNTTGQYITYTINGYASLAIQTHNPVLRIPAVSGFVQPSAIVEALAIGVKATSYYELDIDHNDAPTLINHGAMTTSFSSYVRGTYERKDDYDTFPGLLKLSKSYNGSREAGGLDTLQNGVRSLSQILNNASISDIKSFLRTSNPDTSPQSAGFSYWVDEPTMTSPGVIHYKSNAGLLTSHNSDILEYGTANTNILSIIGSYDGVAYDMTDMRFTSVGFSIDVSGNTIAQGTEVVNSWSSSLSDVFQSANIINDVNGLAYQFSGDFSVQIPGSVRNYDVAQPVSLLVMSGNTLSPVSGVYNIMSVTHTISSTFVTTLKLQRLEISTANMVAAGQHIYVSGSANYNRNSFTQTKNVISPSKVDFGIMYPTFEHMYSF